MDEEALLNLRIVIGTYEEYVVGYQLIKDDNVSIYDQGLKYCWSLLFFSIRDPNDN